MERSRQLGKRADERSCRRSASLRSFRSIRPLRVGQPKVSRMVGKTADAMMRSNSAKFALSAEVLAILSISPLTSNLASCMLRHMAVKKNPHAVALGKLGGKARAASLSESERSAIASRAGKARSEKLSAAERSRIATLAVQARERKRKQRRAQQERRKLR